MARTDDVMQQVRAYSDALGSTLTVLERLSAWVRGLRDPKIRAMRLRHRSARLLRAAKRAASRGHAVRASNLLDRAEDAWKEAQQIEPVDALAAARNDATVANV